jgi:NAD-dependent SIR2 family protein deacetylase
MRNDRNVFIVGAGFSANAGLPLQAGFTKLFLSAEDFTKGMSRHLMSDLKEFANQTFGFDNNQPIDLYPALEDLFTTLDLSANTGHHLGRKYSPASLRRLRRMLLSRIILMLNSSYLEGKKKVPPERQALLEFLKKVPYEQSEFISLNWDVVLEGCLEELGVAVSPSYSREIDPVTVTERGLQMRRYIGKKLRVAKMHGSINWLYCDCCRRTFSTPLDQVTRLARQVLHADEAEAIYGPGPPRLHCLRCKVDLGVRLATFSYQKALRTPMFESSWMQAEKALRRSRNWIFVGYSLPGADFEFKYLLKRVQLSGRSKPVVKVVTKFDVEDRDRSESIKSYKRFFGEQGIAFYSGVSAETIAQIL